MKRLPLCHDCMWSPEYSIEVFGGKVLCVLPAWWAAFCFDGNKHHAESGSAGFCPYITGIKQMVGWGRGSDFHIDKTPSGNPRQEDFTRLLLAEAAVPHSKGSREMLCVAPRTLPPVAQQSKIPLPQLFMAFKLQTDHKACEMKLLLRKTKFKK